MLELTEVEKDAPLTADAVRSSPRTTKLLEFLNQLKVLVGNDDDWALIIKQSDEIIGAAKEETPLVAYTYDDDMILINLFSNVFDHSIVTQTDEFIEISIEKGRIRMSYCDIDEVGASCASIRVF